VARMDAMIKMGMPSNCRRNIGPTPSQMNQVSALLSCFLRFTLIFSHLRLCLPSCFHSGFPVGQMFDGLIISEL
jgi:hypothetical protein